MARALRVGLKLIPQLTSVDDLRAVWLVADEAGFDHCWVYDHFLPASGEAAEGDVFDGWSLLAAMAALTERVRIGILVTGNTYRHPGILAKMAVTVDHLSGGRLECGIGAGWAEREHSMFALEYGTPGTRIARLGEACQILKSLWTQDETTFTGAHYTVTEAIANPKPVQRPHPPLWIGGRGERKLLRVVAEHADVWNTTSRDLDEEIRLSGVLDRHCETVGRDPATIGRSIQLYYRGNADAVVAQARDYVAAGFTELVVTLYDADPVAAAATVADSVLPRLRELG
jgi:F420-dependent oxidoreductase-like protein